MPALILDERRDILASSAFACWSACYKRYHGPVLPPTTWFKASGMNPGACLEDSSVAVGISKRPDIWSPDFWNFLSLLWSWSWKRQSRTTFICDNDQWYANPTFCYLKNSDVASLKPCLANGLGGSKLLPAKIFKGLNLIFYKVFF